MFVEATPNDTVEVNPTDIVPPTGFERDSLSLQ